MIDVPKILRHGFDLIVKNTFYTVPIEEEEDWRFQPILTLNKKPGSKMFWAFVPIVSS